MDYYKLKLLFIVLTSKLIAAQNLKNLSYGELGSDDISFIVLIRMHEVNDTSTWS